MAMTIDELLTTLEARDLFAEARLVRTLTGNMERLVAALEGVVERGTDSPEHLAAESAISEATSLLENARG